MAILVILSWALLLIATDVQAFAPKTAALGSRARTTSFYDSATKGQVESNAFADPNYPDHEFVEYVNYVVDHPRMMREHGRRWYDEFVEYADSIVDDQPMMMRENRRNNEFQFQNHEEGDQAQAVAAGVGTGVLGMLVCGPIGAMVLGFSAAYAAEKQQGVVGDSARAMGDVALSAKAKATEIDNKYHVVQETIAAAGEAWEKAKELDREHKILQKAKDITLYSSAATVDFVRRHNLVERGLISMGKGACWVSDRIASGSLGPVGASDEGQSESSGRPAYKRISS